MGQFTYHYTIAFDSTTGATGRDVTLNLMTDEPTVGPTGSTVFPILSLAGNYAIIDASGAVLHTDAIVALQSTGADNENQYIEDRIGLSGTSHAIGPGGVSFSIDNAADSNDGAGNVRLYYGVGGLQEAGSNHNPAVGPVSFCFAAGTAIRTPRGDVPVERLSVGDAVVTASGAIRPIKWLGHRTVQCRWATDRATTLPVRIAADAFGPGAPMRDLFVSPGHAICVTCVDEVLIPADALINGATIRQVDVDTVDYWHVELDSHDILLAEGLPAESYMDVGGREFFSGANVSPDPQIALDMLQFYCRPFVRDGAIVAAVRERLRAIAETQGWTLDTSPRSGVRLVVDGQTVQPDRDNEHAMTFRLPDRISEMRLLSDTSVPEMIGGGADSRRLGVAIGALTLIDDHCETRRISARDPALRSGFHAPEGPIETGLRWTNGNALLPSGLWDGLNGPLRLRIDFAAPSPARWRDPTSIAVQSARAA